MDQVDSGSPQWVSSHHKVKILDDASALPREYPGWMVDFQNARDPRGVGGAAHRSRLSRRAGPAQVNRVRT